MTAPAPLALADRLEERRLRTHIRCRVEFLVSHDEAKTILAALRQAPAPPGREDIEAAIKAAGSRVGHVGGVDALAKCAADAIISLLTRGDGRG